MGTYINIGNAGFQRARNSEYVDKSGLIAVVNNTLNTEHSFSCVTRSRRFGKSLAAKMLCAYYDHSCDSRSLFADLEIASDPSFEQHLNKYPVIYLDLSEFMGDIKEPDIVGIIQQKLNNDLIKAYPTIPLNGDDGLMQMLLDIFEATQKQFILIIDEWDAICREYSPGTKVMDDYVNWLRSMFKGVNGSRVFAGVYMTGSLPTNKYGAHGISEFFTEYSMVQPRNTTEYFGFTESEVRGLAEKYDCDYNVLKYWYGGYQIGSQMSIFNPHSTINAIYFNYCTNTWWGTSSYHDIESYINTNFEYLKDDITMVLSGGRCKVDVSALRNGLFNITSRDDVLTALIHFGFLNYDEQSGECYTTGREAAERLACYIGIKYDRETKQHTCRIEKLS